MVIRFALAALMLAQVSLAAAQPLPPEVRIDGVVMAPFGSGGDVPLDWCLNFGRDCGEPLATALCREFGYQRAASFEKAVNLGRTYVVGAERFCEDPECDGMRDLACSDPIDPNSDVQQREFYNPRINGPEGPMRVDYCRVWARECGWPAADRFCALQGYKAARSFTPYLDVGATGEKTIILDGRQICDGPGCDSFRSILCDGAIL